VRRWSSSRSRTSSPASCRCTRSSTSRPPAPPSSASSPWSRCAEGVGEAQRLDDAFRARVIDATTESFVFEITGKGDKIDQFVALMQPLGLVEVARTGVAALNRGPEGM